jgi:hypothetical protein
MIAYGNETLASFSLVSYQKTGTMTTEAGIVTGEIEMGT